MKITREQMSELEKLAQPLFRFYHQNLDMNCYIIFDWYGVHVTADECFVPNSEQHTKIVQETKEEL